MCSATVATQSLGLPLVRRLSLPSLPSKARASRHRSCHSSTKRWKRWQTTVTTTSPRAAVAAVAVAAATVLPLLTWMRAAPQLLLLRLQRHGGKPLGELPLDSLTLFLGGQGPRGWQLHQMLGTQVTGLVARSTDRKADWTLNLNGTAVPRGYSREEALLPEPRQSFDGYRLLQEYYAMPERFHFIELTGLSGGVARTKGDA